MKKAGYRFSFFLVSHWRRFNAVEISGVTFELLQTHEQPLFIVQLSLSFPLSLSLSLFLSFWLLVSRCLALLLGQRLWLQIMSPALSDARHGGVQEETFRMIREAYRPWRVLFTVSSLQCATISKLSKTRKNRQILVECVREEGKEPRNSIWALDRPSQEDDLLSSSFNTSRFLSFYIIYCRHSMIR